MPLFKPNCQSIRNTEAIDTDFREITVLTIQIDAPWAGWGKSSIGHVMSEQMLSHLLVIQSNGENRTKVGWHSQIWGPFVNSTPRHEREMVVSDLSTS
jgi:hypothetical protein